jgi:lysozyme family protein
MADIQTAIGFVLRQEDSRLTGQITNDPTDRGGRTRFGIAERFHPELTKMGFFDSMPYSPALSLADSVYAGSYAMPLKLQGIAAQQVANAQLSFAINEGTGTAIKILQRALGVAADGIMGDGTLHALNTTSVLPALERQQQAYYADIVAKNPSQQRFFNGWMNRVKQDCGVA